MNRIDELIAELCPEGVKFQSIGDVVEFRRGKRVVRKNLSNEGELEYPVYQNSLIPLGYFGESNAPAESAFIIVAGAAGDIGFSAVDYWAADDCFYAHCPDFVDDRFLYHFLLENQRLLKSRVRKASIPRLPRASIEKLKFPVPPLEVQRVIVDILDQFVKLEAELEAELEARKRQYEFYAGRLIAPSVAVHKQKLGEIATIVRGASPRPIRSFITDEESGIPWIKIGDVPENGKYITEAAQRITEAGAKKSRRIRPGDFVLSNSMSFGRPYISKIEGCIHDGWLSISGFERTFSPDYLYYLLRSEPVQSELTRRAGSGTVKNLNADIVKSIEVPVPALDDQIKIVKVLDLFDTLVNDLSSGLPAEIAARRKQYEYYRDKLLTFKELAS